MPVQLKLKDRNNGAAHVKVYTNDVDHRALKQLKNMISLPIIHSHIAAMPDVHAGIGATVGTVIPTVDAVIPAAVGVDIGCGMSAVRLDIYNSQLPDNLANMRAAIECAVPVGMKRHKMVNARTSVCKSMQSGIDQVFQRHPNILKMLKRPQETWVTQMGTLGSGNHFIEVCVDESKAVWLMLHSGSRGIGNAIGRYFIALAKRDMRGHMQNLPDKDLAYFAEGNKHLRDYIAAVEWAQNYASVNRNEMMKLVIRAIEPFLPDFRLTHMAINCHHNYVQREFHFGKSVYLTRKGAISAQTDELGIIPGSMGARSYIVRGKGNSDAFCSSSHGAGRTMSRAAAKKRFSKKDLLEQTRGVECRKDSKVIDEIPGAYKDIDQVMSNQSDLVDIVHTLKQVLCVKG